MLTTIDEIKISFSRKKHLHKFKDCDHNCSQGQKSRKNLLIQLMPT